ncbi:MAG: hypothetical protein Q9195_008956 [Heterodermia aff. obscurata]
MPSSENIELEPASSPSSSRQRDPETEDNVSRDVSSTVDLGSPTPLEAVVVPNLGGGADETDEFDAIKENQFRPGYEEGLLVFLRRFARLIADEPQRLDLEWFSGSYNLRHIEVQENLDWACATLSAIKNRDELLPRLPTNVSHPLLRRCVFQVNRCRHTSMCYGRYGSRPPRLSLDLLDASTPAGGLLQQLDPPGSDPSMTSRLFRAFNFFSGHTKQQQAWQSLKGLADAVSNVCPLQGLLRVTVCDFGYDRRSHKFDTTLGSVDPSEFSETLCFTLNLRMLMATRTGHRGTATLVDSPLDSYTFWQGSNAGAGTSPWMPFPYGRDDQSLLENGISFDFFALREPNRVVGQLRNWARFSDNDDLTDYLNTMNRIGWEEPLYPQRPWRTLLGYWSFARSLIPREIGGNDYIDNRGDANFVLPELPPLRIAGSDEITGRLFRDTFKAVCIEDHLITMSALTFSPERNGCHCGEYESTDNAWAGHDSYDLNKIFSQMAKMRKVDPKWFLTYLVTELMGSSTIPNLQNVYVPVMQEMRSRRHSSRNAVDLVRKMVKLIDEITQIQYLNDEKVLFLNQLRKENEQYEQTGHEQTGHEQTDHEQTDHKWRDLFADRTTTEMIDQALFEIREQNNRFPQYLRDLRSNLDVIFQLASIEQNELSLKADKNNRAILVFTTVTIVFLPLSFFTSYFGMNIQGIANSDKTQRYFWAVCGTSTALIVGLTVLYGFKERVQTRFFRNRKKARILDESLLSAGI